MDNTNQISHERETVIDRQKTLFRDALVGLKCDKEPRWWQRPRTPEELLRCQWYAEQESKLAKLGWSYYIPCYDGPGHDCSQVIPVLERTHGAWLDALAASHTTPVDKIKSNFYLVFHTHISTCRHNGPVYSPFILHDCRCVEPGGAVGSIRALTRGTRKIRTHVNGILSIVFGYKAKRLVKHERVTKHQKRSNAGFWQVVATRPMRRRCE